MKTIRVLPGKNEDRFMELFKQFKYTQNVICRLGNPYNEYDIADYDYDRFEEELNSLDYISKGETEKMSFVEKAKNFVKEHPLEIAIGAFSVIAFGFGYAVCDTVSAKEHLEQLKTATRTGISIGGIAGMTTVAGFIGDKVPEADKFISEYCDKNNVDFDKLFQENPMIMEATKRFGEISLPLPKITY